MPQNAGRRSCVVFVSRHTHQSWRSCHGFSAGRQHWLDCLGAGLPTAHFDAEELYNPSIHQLGSQELTILRHGEQLKQKLLSAGITVLSPVQEYAEAIEEVDDAAKSQAHETLDSVLGAMDPDMELSLEGTGFYAIQSCMNHSCQPSAHAMQSTNDEHSGAVIVATRNIAAGQEVTISYIDETLPYRERQEALQDYGFQCTCPLCQR